MILMAQQVDAARLGGFLVGMLCTLSVILVVGTLVGGLLLMFACGLYNKFAGGRKSRDAVPEPTIGKAMGIVLVAALANMAVGFVIALVVVGGAAATGRNPNSAAVLVQLLSAPVGILALTAMIAAMLPTSLGRAALVALLHAAIGVLIVATIGILVLVSIMTSGTGPAV